MRKIGFLLIIILTLNSCASILNRETTTVKISADKASKIIFKNDTISINREKTTINPLRSKKPLHITVLKDSLQQDFSLKKKISANTFLNVYNYGAGVIYDIYTNKAFRYANNLHFVTDSISNKIVLSNKKITIIPKNKLFVYTSPLKPFDFFSIPTISLGTEYFISNNFSVSAEYGVLFPDAKIKKHTISYLEEKAFSYRFETKWYNGINLTKNVHLNEYIGLEFREISSQYNEYLDYYDKNDPIFQENYIRDDFATEKRVTIVNLKYGLLVPVGKRFYFDLYTGVGLRIKRFNRINLEYDSEIHNIKSDNFFSFAFQDFQDYDKKNLFNFSLGCKFGIKF